MWLVFAAQHTFSLLFLCAEHQNPLSLISCTDGLTGRITDLPATTFGARLLLTQFSQWKSVAMN